MLYEPEGEVMYIESLPVVGLEPGLEVTLAFPEYRFGTLQGTWTAKCSTYAAEDSNRINDVWQEEFQVTFWMDHRDVGVRSITTPSGIYDTGATVERAAVWHNYFPTPATFDAFFIIDRPDGTRASIEQVQVVGLAGNADTALSFGPFRLDSTQGDWTVRCSSYIAFDTLAANDALASTFGVWLGGKGPWPYGWSEVRPMPTDRSGKPVKAGGWIDYMPERSLYFAGKGNNTDDFYSYSPLSDRWTPLARIPTGPAMRQPKKGAIGCADNNRYVYLARGNNTMEFLRYDAAFDTWEEQSPIPLAPSNKKVKGGGDAVFVEVADTGYVYFLKGGKCDFYRFNTVSNTWEDRRSAPIGTSAKWDVGSWLVSDGAGTIYAHRAKKHDLWAYDVAVDSWTKQLSAMPYMRVTGGRAKKAQAGSSAAWFDGSIYALKGGNTGEFYRYEVAGDSWIGLDSMPPVGSSGKKKKVKDGGSMAIFGDSIFFALKGNGTNECWRYRLAAPVYAPQRPGREGVTGTAAPVRQWVAITPNPTVAGRASLSYELPAAGGGRVMVCDIMGRLVYTAALQGRAGVVGLDLHRLSAGVYPVRVDAAGQTQVTKLIVR